MHRALATLALASILTSFTPPEDPLCPAVCTAVENPSSGGTVPSGVTYLLIFNPPLPGDGTNTCATCTQCTMTGGLIFNGDGTGWCIRVSTGGVGSSAPLPSYSRPGKLAAICDGSDCVYTEIVNCTTGQSSGFNELYCLACGCDAQ